MTAWPVPFAGDCTTTRTSGSAAAIGLGRLGPGDDDDVVGARLARGVDDPGQHRQPAQLVQDFRQRRAHPGAQPAGHDDRGDGSHRRGARGSARAVYRASPGRDDSSALAHALRSNPRRQPGGQMQRFAAAHEAERMWNARCACSRAGSLPRTAVVGSRRS